MFERLSENSRYQRFLSGIRGLSEAELAYLTEVDHHDHEALIAFGPDADALGVARFVRATDSNKAEAAVTVIDQWQGRGLGAALTGLLAERAREEAVECFTALVLATNVQMQEVLETLGPARVISRDAGTVQIEVDVPPEGIGDQMAGVLRVMAGGGGVELATPPWGLRPVRDPDQTPGEGD